MIPLVLDRLVIGRSGADPYFGQPIAILVVRIRFVADVRVVGGGQLPKLEIEKSQRSCSLTATARP
jgi:hypothetical protein